jgi:phage-related holin
MKYVLLAVLVALMIIAAIWGLSIATSLMSSNSDVGFFGGVAILVALAGASICIGVYVVKTIINSVSQYQTKINGEGN